MGDSLARLLGLAAAADSAAQGLAAAQSSAAAGAAAGVAAGAAAGAAFYGRSRTPTTPAKPM